MGTGEIVGEVIGSVGEDVGEFVVELVVAVVEVVVGFLVVIAVVIAVVVVIPGGGKNIELIHSKKFPGNGRTFFAAVGEPLKHRIPKKTAINWSFIFLALSTTKLEAVTDHPF